MKKIMSIFISLVLLSASLFADDVSIATFKGNAQFLPAVESILKTAGYDVKSTVYEEQSELIAALAQNKTDLAFFLAQPIITGVKGAQFIQARLMNTDFVAVTTDPSINVKGAADLKNYKLGIVKDQPGQNAAARGASDIVYADTEFEQFKLLKEGKVQVIVSVRDLVVPMTRANGMNNAIVIEPPVMKNPTFIAVSGKAANRKAEFDNLFQKAMNDGSWNKELGKLKK